jgi:ferredoxin
MASELAMSERVKEPAPRLRINPILCDAVGYCAEIAPELISLDDWGYPIVPGGAITDVFVLRHAAKAVALCPRAALALSTDPERA